MTNHQPAPTSPDPACIVVGGGLAGLSAAVRLAGRGARVILVEARPELGGRTSSFTDPETGDTVDNGQHVLLGCYHETRAFLAAIGAAEAVRFQPGLTVTLIDRAGRSSTLQTGALPPPWHLMSALVEWDALGAADRWSALRMARAIRIAGRQARGETRQIAASPGETVETWLIRNGQSARLREMLWHPLALAALNQSPHVAAAPPFAAVLGRMFGSAPEDAALGLATMPLKELFAEPARRYLDAHGAVVRTAAPAEVGLGSDGRARVRVKGETLDASAVIVAVPWFAFGSTLRDVAPLKDVVDRAARMRSSPIVTVNLWLDRPILHAPFVGLPGRIFQWVFDKGEIFEGGASHLSLVSSGADDLVGLGNGELVRIALEELTDTLPQTRAATVRRALAVREKQATFSLALDQPPRPGVRTPVPNLFLAGDWIDTGLPGTIESAVASGHRAADLVLNEGQ